MYALALVVIVVLGGCQLQPSNYITKEEFEIYKASELQLLRGMSDLHLMAARTMLNHEGRIKSIEGGITNNARTY